MLLPEKLPVPKAEAAVGARKKTRPPELGVLSRKENCDDQSTLAEVAAQVLAGEMAAFKARFPKRFSPVPL